MPSNWSGRPEVSPATPTASSMATTPLAHGKSRRTSNMKSVRVLLVDDSSLIRRGLKLILGRHKGLKVVGESETAAGALSIIRTSRPDVVVVDIRLGKDSGIQVLEGIRADYPEVRTLCLTAYDDPASMQSAFLAGTDGYLMKDAPGATIARVIRTISAGGTCFPPSLGEHIVSWLRGGTRRGQIAATRDLPHQENQLLSLIALGKSNKEIAEALGVATPIVRTKLTKLFNRLGIVNRTQAAFYYAVSAPRDGRLGET